MSGPGDVQFADANATVTTATFSAPGAYVLQVPPPPVAPGQPPAPRRAPRPPESIVWIREA